MKILITNDDDFTSPLLHFLIEYFSDHELTIVVPATQQSWKGKSMTRMEELWYEEFELAGKKAFKVNGTPADCVNLGIYNFSESKPDLVISGPNLGYNIGMSFLVSSGTVGAAIEGNIARIPSIALSQQFDQSIDYYDHDNYSEELKTKLRTQINQVLDKVFEKIISNSQLLQKDVTWNVNMPFNLVEKWELRPTFLSHSTYDKCYDAKEGRITFGTLDCYHDLRENSDIKVIDEGHVSVNPINIKALGWLADSQLEELFKSLVG